MRGDVGNPLHGGRRRVWPSLRSHTKVTVFPPSSSSSSHSVPPPFPLTKAKVQEGTSGPDHQQQMGGIPGGPLVHPSTSGTCSQCGDVGTETGEMEDHAKYHSAK